ncbi:hypothetical protein F3Y22_tig00110678pilonHSYRG00462 [Hibiscus syriacus]|uniref:Ubiquitin-like protease family profile domain-containing protein n=1 Tax=Hibiscus syriacus TaxID=106335 RepID=A0A6A2ZVR7_HIBSY|nr:hypothetical protein F3Y22_tig00110678pilonHSYRG00462 [Hibiscus syriacus]
MDKAWISSDRLPNAYEVDVNTFLDFAQSNDPNSYLIRCPCIHCINLWHHSIQTVHYHLFAYGFEESYKVWSFHGERQPELDSRCPNKSIPPDFDYTRDMLHDAFRDVEKALDSLKSLLEECEKPLYVGSKYNALSGLLKFQHIKGQFGWSEASFEVLLSALKDVLPLNNRIPNSLYDAKKLLKGVGPKQPCNNIDVYLSPLIADLKLLWETGVKTYDAYKKEYFNLRAILLWTVNDFPAYDIMHIEKNTCESVYGTLLNLPAKTKNELRARQDLEAMGIKPELQTQPRGIHTWLPPACYTLNTTEKHRFYETLSTIKVPDGYCSNFKNLVSDDVSKMNGLKSNDCHVLMQQLLLFAIKGVLHVKVKKTIIEKYFPPSFFDVMIHLMMHLVREVRLCGPVHFRWMYPFERYMKTLKGYVRNHHRPEGCIAECYVAEEALEFCSVYLKNMKSIGNPHERVDERIRTGKPLSQSTVETQHSRTFISWLKTKVDTHFTNGEVICEPSFVVKKYNGFAINEYLFHTTSRDESRTTQCSGVSLVAHAMQIASAKDSNPVYGAVTYYVVNFARLDHQSERFILTSQAKQVFYVQDQQDANLSVVSFTLHKMYKYGANGETDDMLEYHATFDFSQDSPLVELDDDFLEKLLKEKLSLLIGVEAMKLASFEGMVARSMVPITYATWQDVEQEKKDLWQYILVNFELDPRSRKNTLQSIGTKWKNFKHYLYKKFIEKFNNDPNANMVNPLEMYPYLKIDEWKVFVSQRLSNKWEEEMQKSETLGEVSCGTNDMLTQALGTQEQRGRVRGMGKFVRPHQYFYLPNTVKNYLDGEKKKIEKRFNQIEGAIEKLQKGMNHASKGASCQGWGKADFEDNPPEELLDTSCYLVIDIVSNIVAKGTIVKHNDLSVESVKVQCEDDMFGYESFTYITWEDFEVVFTVDEMTSSAITCYMMYLFEEIKNGPKIDHGICFMSPSVISPSGRKAKFKNSDETIRSVADRLSLRKDNDIVLVPYNPRHWVLAVIDMKATSCYYLDSLGPTNIHQQLKHVIDVAMKLYTAQSGSNKRVSLNWINVLCPRQSRGIECGYYVCKFMKEIVENGLQVLVNNKNLDVILDF